MTQDGLVDIMDVYLLYIGITVIVNEVNMQGAKVGPIKTLPTYLPCTNSWLGPNLDFMHLYMQGLESLVYTTQQISKHQHHICIRPYDPIF